MPRPRSLTTDAIAAAALAVLDRDGRDSLSMRNVARELDMSPMALYRYVTDRDELEQLIVEAVLAPVRVDVPDSAHWAERVVVLVGRVRDAAGAHPEAVPYVLAWRHSSHRTVRWIETMLGTLTDAGFTGTELVIAQRTIVHYLIGAIQAAHRGSLTGAGTDAMTQLPRDEFPHLSHTARMARDIGPDDEFRRGLNIVLEGLKAALAANAADRLHPKCSSEVDHHSHDQL